MSREITDLIRTGTEDLETFLRAYEFELDQRRAAERRANPPKPLQWGNPTPEDGSWSRQLLSTRACARTKL